MKKLVKNEILEEIARMAAAEGGFVKLPIIICDSYKIRVVNDEILFCLINEAEEKEYIPEKWSMIPFNNFVKVITKRHIYFAPRAE